MVVQPQEAVVTIFDLNILFVCLQLVYVSYLCFIKTIFQWRKRLRLMFFFRFVCKFPSWRLAFHGLLLGHFGSRGTFDNERFRSPINAGGWSGLCLHAQFCVPWRLLVQAPTWKLERSPGEAMESDRRRMNGTGTRVTVLSGFSDFSERLKLYSHCSRLVHHSWCNRDLLEERLFGWPKTASQNILTDLLPSTSDSIGCWFLEHDWKFLIQNGQPLTLWPLSFDNITAWGPKP